MAMSLRSTKRARVDLTWASSCIRSRTPHSAASTADAVRSMAAANSSAGRRSGLAPVIIEVEPVVGSGAAIVLEPAGIALQQALDHRLARGAVKLFHARQPLEANLVAIAAAVEAEHERDRALQHRGDAHWARRERGALAQE